jgi:hypothetical protein
MGVVLGFVSADGEAAHVAGVAALALQLLVLDHIYSLDKLKAVDAGH